MSRLKIGKASIIVVMLSMVFSLLSFTPAQAANGSLITWRNAYSVSGIAAQTLSGIGTRFSINSGTDRILVVGISAIVSASSTMSDPSVVKYGNVSLTKATGNGGTSGRMHTWLYYLLDNTSVMNNTSKELDVTASSPNGVYVEQLDVFYAVYTGIDQSGTYTTGNGFTNGDGSGPAKLSSAISIPANAQAVYMSSIYNSSSDTIPAYTLNTNWASGASMTGYINFFCTGVNNSYCGWKNEAAYRTVSSTDTTDDAATSAVTPHGSIRYAISALVLPKAPVTTSVACDPTFVDVHSTTSCTATVTRVNGNGTPTGTITFSSDGSGDFDSPTCTLAGSNGTASCSVNYTPSHVGKGIHTLTAAYAGDANFNLSSNTTAETVNPMVLTVTATGVGTIYDGTINADAALAISGEFASDTDLIASGTASYLDKNVAAGKEVDVTGITVTGTNAADYTWNTTAQTTADVDYRPLNVTATGINKVYDATPAATVTLNDDRVIGDDLTVTYTSAAFSTSAIGSAIPVTVDGIAITGGADAGNYTLANTSAETTANITGYITNLIVIFNHFSW